MSYDTIISMQAGAFWGITMRLFPYTGSQKTFWWCEKALSNQTHTLSTSWYRLQPNFAQQIKTTKYSSWAV